jgi:hypothetical protein
MAPSGDSLCGRIAETVAARLARGIAAGEAALFYARSSLGLESEEEMGALLSLGERDESGIARIVFHPDEELRLAVEPLIPGEGLPAEALRRLAEEAGVLISRVRVLLPGGTEAVMDVAGALLGRFIGSLNLHIPLADLAEDDRSNSIDDNLILRARVMIRSSGFRNTARREEFLRRMHRVYLVERRAGAGDFLARLDFILRLFRDAPDDGDIYSMIAGKRNELLLQMNRAREYEEARAAMGNEYMMLRKIHPPVFNPVRAESELRYAEELCREVCGREAGERPSIESFNFGVLR